MGICEGCHAGCCRSFAIPVTGADILRIERDLGLDFWQFICRWADPQGSIAQNYAPHFYFDDEPETPFAICLIQRESTLFPGTTSCQFLHEDPPNELHPLGVGSCSIYGQRPAACRVFPTKFHPTDNLVQIGKVPDRGRELSLNPMYQLCSRPWTAQDVDPLQGPQELVVAKYEMDFFHQIARQWNQHLLSWEVFPEFLRLVYSGRVVTETETQSAFERRAA